MKKLYMLTMMFLTAGIFIGFVIGSAATASFIIGKAQLYFNSQGLNVSLDKDQVAYDIYRYENRIGGCNNASLYDDQRN